MDSTRKVVVELCRVDRELLRRLVEAVEPKTVKVGKRALVEDSVWVPRLSGRPGFEDSVAGGDGVGFVGPDGVVRHG